MGTSTTTYYYSGKGMVGAPLPPRGPRRLPLRRSPDWNHWLPTLPQQALWFRLHGDRNPLHVDPQIAAQMPEITGGRPILHGLCSFGLLNRAVALVHGASRIHRLNARFSRPLWPGDTLMVEGWNEGPEVVLRAARLETPQEEVMTVAVAGLFP